MAADGDQYRDERLGGRGVGDYASMSALAEARIVVDRLLDLWRNYITWYTFAFTSNLLALSWVGLNPTFFRDINEPHLRTPALLFAGMWVLINALNVIGVVVVDIYTGRRVRRARALIAAEMEGSQVDRHLWPEPNFPRWVTVFTTQGNAIALLTFMLVWLYVMVRALGLPIDELVGGYLF